MENITNEKLLEIIEEHEEFIKAIIDLLQRTFKGILELTEIVDKMLEEN